LNWYLPSFHGDIKLTRNDRDSTSVRVFELTPSEERAVETLRKLAVEKSWAKGADFLPIENAAYRTSAGLTITIAAPIEEVQAILARAMKPERALLSAVIFDDGRVEEVHDTLPETPVEEPQPTAAVTVAEPVKGCPVPEFPESEVRANLVLESFLTPAQVEDYRRYGAFVSRGATSGHRYRITHRERRREMEYASFRSLFDLDEHRGLCVHDWSVPPPEEMLALHLCLTMPGHEKRIRLLPEVWH
jgi:hypothetical protein